MFILIPNFYVYNSKILNKDIKFLFNYNIMNWFSFLNKKKENYIGFEDVKLAIKDHTLKKYLLINTLQSNDQECLIKYTIHAKDEESVMNSFLLRDEDINIIVYGRNSTDENANRKYKQIQKLGFDNVYLYTGGLFEWLLLQEVYGKTEFPTTTVCRDILQYRVLPTF